MWYPFLQEARIPVTPTKRDLTIGNLCLHSDPKIPDSQDGPEPELSSTSCNASKEAAGYNSQQCREPVSLT